MSQIVCPKCSEKEFLLTIGQPTGLNFIISYDPVGTLECPRCHTTMEFRACALPKFLRQAVPLPAQRFECREYIGPRHPMYGAAAHMRPSFNGEWVRHADHVEAVEKAGSECELRTTRRENAYLQKQLTTLRAEKDTLHAQWERQKGTISYLSEENDELKKKLQVAESQKNQAAMDVAREQRDRWMREIREYHAMPLNIQPGGIFYTHPYPSHAEVTIKHLNERILEQGKEMDAFRRMHTEAVNDLTAELAACRSTLKQAEKERDQPSDELAGARRENAFLRRDLGKFRDQLDTTQKELAAEKLKLQKFREVLIGLTF